MQLGQLGQHHQALPSLFDGNHAIPSFVGLSSPDSNSLVIDAGAELIRKRLASVARLPMAALMSQSQPCRAASELEPCSSGPAQ